MAYAALPEVIQHGTVIYTIDKGRGLERIVTAAPIRIGTHKYFMAVMLQRDPTSQRLYAHDVVIAEESTSNVGRHLDTNRAGNNGDKLFITDILQNALAVKGDSAKESKSQKQTWDSEYEAAVEAGDMDEAQRLVDRAAEAAMPESKIRMPCCARPWRR